MSAISEINKVWLQKFPGSSLPEAWAEDVKTNLSKHKKRVVELEEELEQEKVYVEFLESLLAEFRQGNPGTGDPSPEPTNGTGTIQDIDDVIKDTLERRSLASQFAQPSVKSLESQTSKVKESEVNRNVRVKGESRRVTREDLHSSAPPIQNEQMEEENCVEDERVEPSSPADDGTDESRDRSHFVTVIEVNGFDKKAGSSSPSQGSSRAGAENVTRLKKVPPRPPPKVFKRQGSDTSHAERLNSNDVLPIVNDSQSEISESLPKARGERPVIFDSRKGSTGNGGVGQSSFAEDLPAGPETEISKPQTPTVPFPLKRFEGSKLPLPGSQSHQAVGNLLERDQDDKIQQGRSQKSTGLPESRHQILQHNLSQLEEKDVPGRSKILDLVNRMESSHKPVTPNKNIEQLAPRRSFRKQFQGPVYNALSTEPVISDYVDPCDAEFDVTSNDTIYDSPPPEDEDFPTQTESPKNRSKTNTLEMELRDSVNPRNYPDNEPMYDTVAPDQDDDYVLLMEEGNQTSSSTNSLSKREHENSGTNDITTIKSQTSIMSGHSVATTTSSGTTSDTEGIAGSPLPHDHHSRELAQKNSIANYVNIDYFLSKPGRKDSQQSVESDDEDDPSLLRSVSMQQESDNTPMDGYSMDSGVFGGTCDSGGMFGCLPTPPGSSRRLASEATTMTAADHEKLARFRCILSNIVESESSYVDVLNVLLQYMKALKATLSTSKPVLSQDEFNIIFYKLPELFELHQKFLSGLKEKTAASVGKHFQILAHDIWVYGAFLQNYSRAVETVRKCSQNNVDFCEIAKNIRLKTLQNQAVSLETLLYSPVSRVQKNTEIIQDLLKCLPGGHPDEVGLKSALGEYQSFLTEFKMIQPEQLFQGQDRNPRHLVKNSFIVELSEGHRKLRHIFLFNDVFVCAKYKPTGKTEKYTFELKWYIPVIECNVIEESSEPKESSIVNLVALRSQASTARDQIKRQTSRDDPKKAKAEKQRKKLAELEAQLVLASPNLVFKIKAGNGRSYTFFLSSEYERSQWVDAINALKTSQPSMTPQLSMQEMQNWLTSCRKHLKTNMGSYLLRSGRDEHLLVGDLSILIDNLKGIQRAADLYICLEVDSYGHFFRKAKTKMVCESVTPCWNQDFTIELEGAQNLRILLYEDHQRQGTLIRAKTTIELNKSWLTGIMTERKIDLQDYDLTVSTKFTPSEMTIRRVPTAKPSGLFGAKITQVCKREKRQMPFILTSCLREVERRGINEVGLYRVSGSTSDVTRLKKAFETNSYEAEQMLKEVDIHSVTGILKLYMRELPEALFTDELYPRFFDAFNKQDQELKKRILLQLFSTLPPINQHIILSLLDHMVRVNKHENHNKMSLHNIATVFGPTLLRPGVKNETNVSTDLLAAGTVDVMAQAGILYFFLTRRASGEPMQLVPSGH